MSAFIAEKMLSPDKQSGFGSNHICISALIGVSETVRRKLDNNKENILILLEHTKEFEF